MLAGRNVLTTTHQDEYPAEHEPPRSGIFVAAGRPAAGPDRHHDAKATLDWLEHRLARRYEGEETLARLARLNDEY